MAAVLATALTFGSTPVFRPAAAPVALRRPFRMACRWHRDPATGRMVATWEPEDYSRPRFRHLTLVRA